MKKIIFIFSIVTLGVYCFAQNKKQTEISLYNQLNSYLATGYFPGVIECAEALEKEYPESVFMASSEIAKGKAYAGMGIYDDSAETLKKVLAYVHTGSQEYTECCYNLGLSLYNLKDYNQALQYFYNAAAASTEKNNQEYYAPSVLFAGKINFILQSYEEAEKPLEYVFYNGNHYSYREYAESVKNLFAVLNKNEKFSKTINLYEKLDLSFFDENTSAIIKLSAGEAWENQKEYLKAYNLYSSLLENPDRNVAVVALQKAYLASHEGNLNINPEEIFGKLKAEDEEGKQLLGEFWLRLGIDYYNKGNFETSRSCFSTAEETGNLNFTAVSRIYKIKMELDEGKTAVSEKELSALEQQVSASDVLFIKDSFYSQLLALFVAEKNWNKAADAYSKIESPEEASVYLYGTALYENGQYAQAAALLKDKSPSDKYKKDYALLYAGASAKAGNLNEAEAAYEKLAVKKQLNDAGKIEYGKVLLSQKKYEKAINQVKGVKLASADYICALCNYNLQNWEEAEKNFNAFINAAGKSDKYFVQAAFYRAYAVFRQAKYTEAGNQFMQLENYTKNPVYLIPAYETGAKACVMVQDYKSAAAMAEKMINASTKKQDKNRAVILASDIYSDWGKYREAADKLLPYINDHSDFALSCMERIASIYEQSNQIESADKMYVEIYTKYKGSQSAENAMYRSASLFYTRENYSEALKRYNKYISNYSNGKYTEEAYYCSADSALKDGDYNKAIMQNQILLSKYPSTIYGYGAYSNLLEDYYQIEDYSSALKTAKLLLEKYNQQAVSDGIGTRIFELEKIISGYDRQLTEKISKYEKKGKTSTAEGRKLGSELVTLYYENGFETEAVTLAEELTAVQATHDDELSLAGKNADFLGEQYSKRGDFKKAASTWLKAAEYYRSSGNFTDGAKVMYQSADAFYSAGMTGDAAAVGKMLIEIYPDSVYADRVSDLIYN